jgi:hypothetical protein
MPQLARRPLLANKAARGPLAPPTRRTRLRSRWRSRLGGADAGRLAREPEDWAA